MGRGAWSVGLQQQGRQEGHVGWQQGQEDRSVNVAAAAAAATASHALVGRLTTSRSCVCLSMCLSCLLLTGGSLLPYELDESRGWAMDIDSLKAAVAKARGEGKCVRGLVFINPGNPTGQCLSYDNLKVRQWCQGVGVEGERQRRL